MANPDDILMGFVSELPATIRENVLAGCNLAFGQFERVKNGDDPVEIFRSLLAADYPVNRAYQVAKLCGTLEVALQVDQRHELFTSSLAAKFPEVESFARSALQAPMQTRHFEQAREQFDELRNDSLSPRALREWQRLLMANNQQK